ncbi:alpha/beta fold hydrolase, partial [Rhizobium ruizarguesonis]
CDHNMWRFVAPAFEADFKPLLFDHVGAGRSALTAYDAGKYSSLSGSADDLVEICREIGMTQTVFVGHSVSAMIGVIASL